MGAGVVPGRAQTAGTTPGVAITRDPSDGEVQTWSSYVMQRGMELQRKFIRTHDTPMTDTAATEAEERFVERLEQSPEAKYLRESTEENTRLRDTFERMAQVTASLATLVAGS